MTLEHTNLLVWLGFRITGASFFVACFWGYKPSNRVICILVAMILMLTRFS